MRPDFAEKCRNPVPLSFYFLGIVLICLFTILQLPDAYYNRKFETNDFECEMGKTFYVDESDLRREGVFCSGPGISLDKGKYIVTINYAANSEENFVSFETEINPKTVENNVRHVLPSTNGQESFEIPLCLNDYTEQLDFTIYYGGMGDLQLFDITVEGQDWKPYDVLAIGCIVLLIYLLLGYVYIRKKSEFFVFGTLIFASIISSYPYFCNYIFYGDDTTVHLLRIAGIRDGILSGQFPVRVYPGAYYGTGYNCSLYYPDIFLYFPAVLCLTGVSLAAALKIFGFFIHVAAVWIMYYSARKMKGTKTAGLIAAILYVFCGYFCHNLFCRVDLGESIAMCFFPLVICGFYLLVFEEERKWKPLCIGVAGIMLSHIISMLFTLVLLFLFSLIYWRKIVTKKVILNFLKAAGTAFCICAWFLIPFFELFLERENTNISTMMRHTDEQAIKVGQLFGEFRESIGLSLAVGGMVCLYCCLSKKIKEDFKNKQILTLCLAGGVLMVCSTSIFPWSAMIKTERFHDVISLIQFPWRLLGPASAFLTLAIALTTGEIFKDSSRDTLELLVSFILVCSFLLFSFRIDLYEGRNEIYMYHGDGIQTTAVVEDYLFQFTQTDWLMDITPEYGGG